MFDYWMLIKGSYLASFLLLGGAFLFDFFFSYRLKKQKIKDNLKEEKRKEQEKI